jgi:hypothetical protein
LKLKVEADKFEQNRYLLPKRKHKTKAMRPIVIIIIIIWIWAPSLLNAQAQPDKDFIYYNQKTYELYLSKNWDALIQEGKEAIDAGYDFFYLHQRIGIAYYELEQYSRAVTHFYNALDFNKEHPVTQEYLYYALLFSGRAAEARLFAQAAGQPLPISLFALGSHKWSDQQTVVDQLNVYSVSLTHYLSKKLLITHSIEYINQQFVEFTEEEVPRPGGGPPRIIRVENRYNYDQNLYRLKGDLQLGRGWQTGLTFQHIWGENEGFQFSQQAYWGYLGKSFSVLRLELEGGYANFEAQDIFQVGMNAVLYPLANTNLYYQAGFSVKNSADETQHWINQRVGIRLAPGLWAEGLVDFGDINYFQEAKGVIAYNIADPIRSRVGANLQYWPGKRWMLFLQFQQEQKTYALTDADYQHQGLMLGLHLQW